MAESKVAVVHRLLERLSSGELEAAIEVLSEDYVGVVPPSMSAEPDVYEGHDGARRYFAGFEGFMEEVRYEPDEVIEEGDAVIVVAALTTPGARPVSPLGSARGRRSPMTRP